MSDNNEIMSFIVIKQEEIETDNTAADSETRLKEENTETILPDNHVIIPDTEMKQEEIETNTIADSETRLREDNTETILPDNHVIIPDTHIKQEIVEDLETRADDEVKQEESRDVSIHYSITTVK